MTVEVEHSNQMNDRHQEPPAQPGRFSDFTFNAPSRYKVMETDPEKKQIGTDPETTEILMDDRVATGG